MRNFWHAFQTVRTEHERMVSEIIFWVIELVGVQLKVEIMTLVAGINSRANFAVLNMARSAHSFIGIDGKCIKVSVYLHKNIMIKEVRVIALMTDPVFTVGMDSETLGLVVHWGFAVFDSVYASLAVEGGHFEFMFAFNAFWLALRVLSAFITSFNIIFT